MLSSDIINTHFTLTYLLERGGNDNIFKKFWLSVQTYSILTAVYRWIHELHILRESTNNTSANIAQKIKRLEWLGYIRREVDSKDKRKRNIYMTDTGEETYTKIHETYHEVADPLFEGIPEEKKEHYIEVMKTLIQRLTSVQ